jgi:tellurite resistance protein TehA-like permease
MLHSTMQTMLIAYASAFALIAIHTWAAWLIVDMMQPQKFPVD